MDESASIHGRQLEMYLIESPDSRQGVSLQSGDWLVKKKILALRSTLLGAFTKRRKATISFVHTFLKPTKYSYLLYNITCFYSKISPTCFGSLLQDHHQGEELNILNFVFQHSIEKPVTPYLTNTAIETENAIKVLDANIQGAYRVLATIFIIPDDGSIIENRSMSD